LTAVPVIFDAGSGLPVGQTALAGRGGDAGGCGDHAFRFRARNDHPVTIVPGRGPVLQRDLPGRLGLRR
jgi:hypothetical protein